MKLMKCPIIQSLKASEELNKASDELDIDRQDSPESQAIEEIDEAQEMVKTTKRLKARNELDKALEKSRTQKAQNIEKSKGTRSKE